MIVNSYQSLKECLKADLKNNHEIYKKNIFVEYLKGNLKVYYKFKFLVYLRLFEYCSNNRRGLFKYLRYLFMKHSFQKIQIKTQLFIAPNTCAEGLNIEHLGYIWIDNSSKLGKNNVILPRVLLGKKSPGITTENPMKGIISTGDNVYIGTGVSILGPVKIGNNVVIAAGSVVIKDIPSNCICAGVPAKVIKQVDLDMLNSFFPCTTR